MEHYQKEKLTIDIVKANVFTILILIPISLLYVAPYYLLHKGDSTIINFKSFLESITINFGIAGIPLFILLISAMGIIAHELIHGIVWSRYSKRGLKSIKFGFLWKILTPYCHCKEPLLLKNYIIGVIMPAIILGLLPAIYAIIFGNLGFLIFGIFFTMVAGGDFLIINLLRNEERNSLVADHPSEAGCYIYRIKKDK